MIILIKEELTENENENEKDEKDEKKKHLWHFLSKNPEVIVMGLYLAV